MKISKKAIVFSLLSIAITLASSNAFGVSAEEIKKIIPKEAEIPEATIAITLKEGKSEYPGPWYKVEDRKRDDCYYEDDLDGDGKKELIILYFVKDVSDIYSKIYNLCIYKQLNNNWNLQFKKQYRAAVVNSFLCENLFATKHKQIIIELGTGASIGYGVDIINWDGKEYVSLICSSELTLGILIHDIDDDRIKEVISHQRYAPLPLIYQWNDKSKYFEIMNDSEKLLNYYRKVIEIVKDPFNEKGELSSEYAWALFECYYRLGDYGKAATVGNQLIEFAKKSGMGWDFYDDVRDKLDKIKKRQGSEE